MLHDDDLLGDVVWKFRDPRDVETFYFVMKNCDEYVPYFKGERIKCNGTRDFCPTQAEAVKECLLHCGTLAGQRMKKAEEVMIHSRELRDRVRETWAIVCHMETLEDRESVRHVS